MFEAHPLTPFAWRQDAQGAPAEISIGMAVGKF